MSPVFIMTDSILLITEDLDSARISGGMFCILYVLEALYLLLALRCLIGFMSDNVTGQIHSFQDFFIFRSSLWFWQGVVAMLEYSAILGDYWSHRASQCFFIFEVSMLPSKVFIFVSIFSPSVKFKLALLCWMQRKVSWLGLCAQRMT